MLKKRIAASLVIKDEIVVQSLEFKRYLPIGDPSITVEFLNQWGIDEILLLDIDATPIKRGPDLELINTISSKIFVPLTIGGGIKTLEQIKKLIRIGADKVSLNSVLFRHPELITEAAKVFGVQCIVASIDVKKDKNGKWRVFRPDTRRLADLDPIKWALKLERLGAGEILLQSVDRDGSKSGYDLELVAAFTKSVKIPVIALGGAGHPDHFNQILTAGGASTAAAGNFFHFTEHSPILIKSYLISRGIDVRIDTFAKYPSAEFDDRGRIIKRSDSYLEDLKFQLIPKEII